MGVIDSAGYWMEQLSNRSEGTKRYYVLHFKKFVEYMGKTPDELVELQKQVRNHEGDLRENQILEGKVRAFIQHLEDKGYSISTRKLVYAAVLSFFKCNLYPLKMMSQDRPNGEAWGSRIPEKEEIVRMVNAAKSRSHRAVILVLKDSGLRISDVVRLRWATIEDLNNGFWSWKVLTRKRKVQATCFIGPEATEALTQLERKHERIFPVNVAGLSHAIVEIAKAAGLKDVSGHGLRKFFNVELQAARIPKEWRYQMMGKKTSVYDENRLTKLFNAYREAYGYLRIYGAPELTELKTTVDNLREENRDLRQKLNNYRDDVEDFRKILEVLRDPGKFRKFQKLLEG